MARLPYGDSAIIDIRKLENYCLDAEHPRGRHKARVFRDALDIGRGDAHWLRDVLLQAIREVDAIEIPANAFGRQWRADVTVTRHQRTVVLRSIWIVRNREQVPRFVTCWVR
jgi:hypothetical protein